MAIKVTLSSNDIQTWLCDGVPSDIIDTEGKSTLFVGDFVKNIQNNDLYQVLTCESDPDNFGVYINVTYQVMVTNLNINNYLP